MSKEALTARERAMLEALLKLEHQFGFLAKLAGAATVRTNGKPVPKWEAVADEAKAGARHAREAIEQASATGRAP